MTKNIVIIRRISHLTIHTVQTVETQMEIITPEKTEPNNRLVLEVEASGKLMFGYIPITLRG